jgi:hypothetical protein
MVNDRVNCSEVYYFLDIQLPYNLTTFSVTAEVSTIKIILPIEVGRGDLLRVKCHAQKKIKKFENGIFFNNIVYLCCHERLF